MIDPFTAITAGSALMGAFAGGQGSSNTTSYGRNMAPESELARLARLNQEQGWSDLENIQRTEFARANQASQDYAELLRQYGLSGGMPTAQDMAQGQAFAQQMYAPQQVAIDQSMRQSTEAARQQAALSGRGPADFAMQTRLSGQRGDLMAQLGAQQSAYGAQYAQQLNQNRLGYAGQLADMQQNLAQQAQANRLAIMQQGLNTQQADMNFRANTSTQTQTNSQPGSLMGALTGAFSGAQAATGLYNMFGGMSGPSNQSMPQQASTAAPSMLSSAPQQNMSSARASTPSTIPQQSGVGRMPASLPLAATMPMQTMTSTPTSNMYLSNKPTPPGMSPPTTGYIPPASPWTGIQGNPWDYNVSTLSGPPSLNFPFPNNF